MSQALFLPLLLNKALLTQIPLVYVGIFLKHIFVRFRFKENLRTHDSILKDFPSHPSVYAGYQVMLANEKAWKKGRNGSATINHVMCGITIKLCYFKME